MKKPVSFTIASENAEYLGMDRTTDVDVVHAERYQTLPKDSEEQTNKWKTSTFTRWISNYIRMWYAPCQNPKKSQMVAVLLRRAPWELSHLFMSNPTPEQRLSRGTSTQACFCSLRSQSNGLEKGRSLLNRERAVPTHEQVMWPVAYTTHKSESKWIESQR